MPKLEIKVYPDPILRAKAQEVTVFDDELHELVEDMFETMYKAPGVGLAAPQVGVSKRLIVLDPGEDESEEGLALVNPRIVEYGGGVESEEGCLSLPEFTAVVARAEWVKVEAQDLSGKPITVETDGFAAIILQHEIDHLDGVMILDRTGKTKRRLFVEKHGKEKIRVEPEILADMSAIAESTVDED